MKDPFPMLTSDSAVEQRLQTLFKAASSILVVNVDPTDKKEGLMWVNASTGTLKVYAGGKTWTIGLESAPS